MTDDLPEHKDEDRPKTTEEHEADGDATQDQEVNQNVANDEQ